MLKVDIELGNWLIVLKTKKFPFILTGFCARLKSGTLKVDMGLGNWLTGLKTKRFCLSQQVLCQRIKYTPLAGRWRQVASKGSPPKLKINQLGGGRC